MTPHLVIPSTTSHKQEPLLPTLEVFAQLGMRELDLNLNHIIDKGTSIVLGLLSLGGIFLLVRIFGGEEEL